MRQNKYREDVIFLDIALGRTTIVKHSSSDSPETNKSSEPALRPLGQGITRSRQRGDAGKKTGFSREWGFGNRTRRDEGRGTISMGSRRRRSGHGELNIVHATENAPPWSS